MSDPFARALNRRALTRLAERDAPRASRHVRLLTALMLDIDHCKRVNDVHGHRVGDEDLPGRPGGEDSARVLPGTEPLRRTARGLACSVRRWMVGKIPKSEVAGVRSVSVADL